MNLWMLLLLIIVLGICWYGVKRSVLDQGWKMAAYLVMVLILVVYIVTRTGLIEAGPYIHFSK